VNVTLSKGELTAIEGLLPANAAAGDRYYEGAKSALNR